MLETELKCMLTKEQYERLENIFTWDWVKEQINSYYTDSKNELKRNGITLRVRTKDNVSKIQVKIHKNEASALQICEESEFETNTIPDGFTAEECKRMTGIALPVVRLGSLTTLRHSLIYCDGVEICLDKNNYLDKTDYEIEIEYTKEIPAKLMDILCSEGVEFKAAATGKCSRFMMRLASIMHGEE